MAFKEKSGKCVVVKQGNTGRVLTSFCGKGADGKAKAEVDRLHRKNKPKSSNRGASAKKKQS